MNYPSSFFSVLLHVDECNFDIASSNFIRIHLYLIARRLHRSFTRDILVRIRIFIQLLKRHNRFGFQKIYLNSTDTVTGESWRKCVFNRMILLHFVFNALTLLSHEIPTELTLRLSYIVGAKEVFIFSNYEVPLRSFPKNYIL